MVTREQIPEPCVFELVWLPRSPSSRRGKARTYGRASQLQTARFELILVWNRRQTLWRHTVRVDAVWLLDGPPDMNDRERQDVRDLLDEELKERFPDVLVRPWNSTIIDTGQ